jgi:predicted nucleic acid-binding protein
VTYLLDTNLVSELRKRQPNVGARAWAEATDGSLMFLSVLTVGELRNGADRLLRRDPHRASAYLGSLSELKLQFGDRILPITDPVAEEWGRLDALFGPLPIVDGLIGATAVVHGLTVVTRNTADFTRAGVSVLNPFTP